jgi:hypothetical protein
MVVVEAAMMAVVWSGRAGDFALLSFSHQCGNGSLGFFCARCMNMPIAAHHHSHFNFTALVLSHTSCMRICGIFLNTIEKELIKTLVQ